MTVVAFDGGLLGGALLDQFPVTARTILVERNLKPFDLALIASGIVARGTLFHRIAFFPDILSTLKVVVALCACDVIVLRMVFMTELHRAFQMRFISLVLDKNRTRHLLLFGSPPRAAKGPNRENPHQYDDHPHISFHENLLSKK
jgi:hypothetical protein